MEIREQECQSDIILLWKALNKEMVMFCNPVVATKKKDINLVIVLVTAVKENFDLLNFERLTK
jgi:hypothetical protein